MGRRNRGDHAAAHPAARAGAGAEPLCRQSGSAPVRGDAACLNRLSPSPSASQASRAAKSSARRSTRAQRTTRSASPRCCWVRAPPRPTRRPPARGNHTLLNRPLPVASPGAAEDVLLPETLDSAPGYEWDHAARCYVPPDASPAAAPQTASAGRAAPAVSGPRGAAAGAGSAERQQQA